jgi:hypothetical protein
MASKKSNEEVTLYRWTGDGMPPGPWQIDANVFDRPDGEYEVAVFRTAPVDRDHYAEVFDAVLAALRVESRESVEDAIDGAFEKYEKEIQP